MKKRILQLTGARREYLYTHMKSHWKTPLTPTQFPESHQAQTFPTGSLKVQFSHKKICQYWRNIIWCSVHTHLHSHHMRSFHSHSLVCVRRFPAGSCLFQLKNKRQKNWNDLYQSFWSDWQNRTLDRKSVSEILKKVLSFQTVIQTKKKCLHLFVLMHVHKLFNSGHY